jgi:hypothetical protein
MANMKIEPNQLIPLSNLQDYIDTSGVYEIICQKNYRSYIGQSTSITRRLFGHIQLLDKGTHSNALLQQDWGEFTSAAFVFRILQEIKYTDTKALHFEERREINIRRRNKIMLYNDHARLYEAKEMPEEAPVIQEVPAKTPKQNTSSEQRAKTSRFITCFDCGALGNDNLTHFKCDDDVFRCQICINKYLGKQTVMLSGLTITDRKSSTKFWRRQMGSKDYEIEMTLALSSYARRFKCKPEKMLMKNPPVAIWQDVEIEKSSLANDWYIDMPIPL